MPLALGKKNSVPGESIQDVLHHGTTLSALCLRAEKGGKTITCLSELFGRSKQVTLCSHLCSPGSNGEGYRKVKTDLWFKGRRMVLWLNEPGLHSQFLLIESFTEREGFSTSVFPLRWTYCLLSSQSFYWRNPKRNHKFVVLSIQFPRHFADVNVSFPNSRFICTPGTRKSHQKRILADHSIPHLMMIHEAKQTVFLFA